MHITIGKSIRGGGGGGGGGGGVCMLQTCVPVFPLVQ